MSKKKKNRKRKKRKCPEKAMNRVQNPWRQTKLMYLE